MTRSEGRTDDALLAASGTDSAAFRVLYDRHAPAVFGFFTNRVADRQTCHDLTAETFSSLYLDRKKFDPRRGTVEQWLYGIARVHLARYQRKQAVEYRAMRKLRVRETHPDRSPFDTTGEVVDRLAAAELTPAALAALDGLSDRDRTVVELRVMDGRSYAEIAAILNCTTGNARIKVFRALKKLKNQMRVDNITLDEGGDR